MIKTSMVESQKAGSPPLQQSTLLDEAVSRLLHGNPLLKTKRFIAFVFCCGALLGTSASCGYFWYLKHTGLWDPSTHLFPAIVILFGLGFTVPVMTITVRVMFLSLIMTFKMFTDYKRVVAIATDLETKVDPIIRKTDHVMDKVAPMTEDIKTVTAKAAQMSEDIVSIAHKTRSVLEHMNGSLDIKVLEGKLDKLADSLSVIARVFTGETGGNERATDPEIPEFDPLKLAGRRRRG